MHGMSKKNTQKDNVGKCSLLNININIKYYTHQQ